MAGRCTILIIIILLTPLQARTARCVGAFAFGKHTAPTSLDAYSTLMSPERRNPETLIRAGLTIQPDFDPQTIRDVGATVLRQGGDYLFISCRSGLIERIAALPGVKHCTVSLKPQPLMDSVRAQCRINQVHGTVPGSLPTPYTGKGVITGILDTDFDTRHPAFLDSTGTTRFLALWNQNDSTGAKKNRFGYGTIKSKSELIADTTFGLTEGSHGTHTSSTMAGSDRASGYYGAAPDGILVAVQYSGQLEIADGLRWICSLADSLKLPCVINLSIGFARGPHDGTSLIDRVIDSLSGPGRIIVGAAGNDGAGYSHIRFQLSSGSSKSTWIQPGVDSTQKRTMYYSGSDFWGEPGKNFSGKFLILNLQTLTYVQSSTVFSTSKDHVYEPDTILFPDSSTGRIDTVIIEAGVDKSDAANRRPHLLAYMSTGSPSLLFGLTVTNPGTSSNDIHGWNIYKKYFTGAGVEGFENGDSLYTVNEVGGTAKRNLTVGGYIGRAFVPLWDGTKFDRNCTPGTIFTASGTGPTIDGRVKPDVSAPALSVIAAISRQAPRNRLEIVRWPDTSTTAQRYGGETGTSMAAPIVAGIVALMLQADPTLTPEKVKTILTETALHDDQTGSLTEKSNKWGAGKVNAYGAMVKLLGISVTNPHSKWTGRTPSLRFFHNKLLLSNTTSPVAVIELLDMQGRIVAQLHVDKTQVTALPATIATGIYSARLKFLDGSAAGSTRIAIVR